MCENFRRPSGTRLRFPLSPALEAPGYCQTPLRGENLSFSFHRIVRNRVVTLGLKPGLFGALDAALKRRSSTVPLSSSRFSTLPLVHVLRSLRRG